MTEHHFSKSATDHACGMLVLVRSRIEAYRKLHGKKPAAMILHEPGASILAKELWRAAGVPEAPPGIVVSRGTVDFVPFTVCRCGQPFAPDVFVNGNMQLEEI